MDGNLNNQPKTFIFIHKHMGIGGIENYLLRTIRNLKKNGNRIIWIFPEGGYIDDSFNKDLMDGSVEIINVNLDKFSWIHSLNIKFDNDEEVIALAFNLFNYIFLEMIKKKYNDIRIDSFFWVPHFKEKGVFLEEFAPKTIQPILRQMIGKIIFSMEKNNNIIYVNKSHLDAFTRKYGYNVENEKAKLLTGSTREILPFDEELALERCKRQVFNIITVGRFSFPHKAYLIGLIQSYGMLKQKYNQLKLTIIGYGQDQDKVIEEIEKLPILAKNDINFVGKVAYDDLRKYFAKAHLNIGVAGTIADGAVTGLISIPVRHYSEVCECYGYLPESRKYTTSSEPGRPIEEFIEEVINMDKEKYLVLSKKAYNTYANGDVGDATDSLLARRNKNSSKTLPRNFILSIRIGFMVAQRIRKIKRCLYQKTPHRSIR
jgi:hypothetical protein